MRRFILLNALFALALTLLAGCEEQPLDQPVPLPAASGGTHADVEYFAPSREETPPQQASFASSEPIEPSAAQENKPSQSTLRSIFNALKHGAADAMEQNAGEAP